MPTSVELSIGSSGPAVMALQLELNSWLPTQKPPLKADGIFGPKTLARVKVFQSNNGLKPDGIVGPLTLSKLQGRGNDVPTRSSTYCCCGNTDAGVGLLASRIRQQFLTENTPGGGRSLVRAVVSFPSLPPLPTLPKFRHLTTSQEMLAKTVYGASLDFSSVFISDAVGLGGRPFTVSFLVGQVMNLGTFSPKRDDLIHELAHVWQAQHSDVDTRFMGNSIQGQASALAGNEAVALIDPTVKSHPDFPTNFPFSPYAYVRGKPFKGYGAEQIANQVEHGEPAIISHMASVSAGVVDPDNVAGLTAPAGIEDRRAPGVIY